MESNLETFLWPCLRFSLFILYDLAWKEYAWSIAVP
jgi:hypothetical protein